MQEENITPENSTNNEEQATSNLKFSFLKFFVSLLDYFKNVVNIRDEVDYEGSVSSIKKDIDF